MIGERVAGSSLATAASWGRRRQRPIFLGESRGRSRSVVATIRDHADRVQPPIPVFAVAVPRNCHPVATRIGPAGKGAALLGLADVAQLVEHFTRNEGVPGWSPGIGLGDAPANRRSRVGPWMRVGFTRPRRGSPPSRMETASGSSSRRGHRSERRRRPLSGGPRSRRRSARCCLRSLLGSRASALHGRPSPPGTKVTTRNTVPRGGGATCRALPLAETSRYRSGGVESVDQISAPAIPRSPIFTAGGSSRLSVAGPLLPFDEHAPHRRSLPFADDSDPRVIRTGGRRT